MTTFKVGVLTSGGDSPGMNAAVRAVVRGGLSRGAEIYGIYEGWQGAVDGGEKIKPLGWRSAGGILQKGGTMLGTARSADFRARDGRKKAAYNLYSRGITGLVVIGGDGSLTGALTLCDEWPELIKELAVEGKLERVEGDVVAPLRVVGLPGSIDNDLYGTDISIGADTALQTIVRAVDQLEIDGGLAPAHLHRRGDGAQLRLPGADQCAGQWRPLGVDPRGGDGTALAPEDGQGPAAGARGRAAPRNRDRGRRRTPSRRPAHSRRDHPADLAEADERRCPRHRAGPRAARRRGQRLRPHPGDAAGRGGHRRPGRLAGRHAAAHDRPRQQHPHGHAAGRGDQQEPGRRQGHRGGRLQHGALLARDELP